MIQNSDRAYFAATIDSEGSIGIYRQKDSNSFKGSIRIRMNDPQGIKFIKSKFGGRFYLEPVSDRVNTYIYCLVFESKEDIKRVWDETCLFIQVKKLQLETLVKFVELREKANELKKSGHKNIHLQYFNLAKRCQSLKTRFWKKD